MFSFISWSELRKVWTCETSSGTDSPFKATSRQNLLPPSSSSFCPYVVSCRKRRLAQKYYPICRKLKKCKSALKKKRYRVFLKKFQKPLSHWKRFRPEKSCCFKRQFAASKCPITWNVWTSCCLKWNVFVESSFLVSIRVRKGCWRPRPTRCTRRLTKCSARSCRMEVLIYFQNF